MNGYFGRFIANGISSVWVYTSEFGQSEMPPDAVKIIKRARKTKYGRVDLRFKSGRELKAIEQELRQSHYKTWMTRA